AVPKSPQDSSVSTPFAEVIGCLEKSAAETWTLTRADNSTPSSNQTTSSLELRDAATKTFGAGRYELIGVGVFNLPAYRNEKVAVKGMLIQGSARRINVTSLQSIGAGCDETKTP